MHPLVSQSPPRDFLPPQEEARAFGKARNRILRTLLRQTFARSRFRVTLIVVLTSLLWGVMFWMFADGFWFLKTTITQPDTHALAVGGVFSAFFFALMLMLVFSSGIILYGSLFRSREIAFLLTIPARTGRVFLHKFQEAIVLSSWGFVLLGSPILLAYGVVSVAPWYYYAMLVPFIVSFVYIPVSIGAIICLFVVRRFPDNRTGVLAGGFLLLAVGGIWTVWELMTGPSNDLLTLSWIQEILGRLRFTDQRLLPSWWLSAGLLDAAAGAWAESILFFTLMISNALFFRQLALWRAGKTYRAAYSGLYGKTVRRKRFRPMRFDRLLYRLLSPLGPAMRLIIVKDVRIFRRDPLQWSQFLIFTGFLVVYFILVPYFTYGVSSTSWVNMVSFLNLAVVGLLLSTFTTRFVYPMISLEGRRFWVLGMLGVSRRTILWSKFFFAAGGAIVPCTLLVLISDLKLEVSWLIVVSHQLTCVVLCLGLAGIAVGFGAWLPNFRADSPSRIAAGFGGTLTLVVSTLYILIVVLLTALPTHFFTAADLTNFGWDIDTQTGLRWWLGFWLAAGAAASLVLSAVATLAPLWIGFRTFQHTEF
ncbi:MAG: hypothetical protein JW959_06825 [Pirellulales bacterium]|nr:hypothetical protein [Pirellulales bacterium]